jgi:NAD(P)-dependent dehydrogenase (short-subunit alcohol dehydrogenase family)
MNGQTREADTAGHTAVVTGAGSGIGRAVARLLLEAGWSVALAGRRAAELEETAGGHRRALCLPTDISDPAAVQALFTAVEDGFGHLDVLFNNAGGFGPSADIGELDPGEWEALLAVNVTGTMLCAGAAFRLMQRQDPRGGRIINNGSISAQVPRPRSVAYTVTKHAIAGLTKSIELDGRTAGISATELDIGNAASAMMEGIGNGPGALQADGSTRVEPVFDLEQAARTVEFIASLPRSVSVNQLTVTAAGMPFIGRG